MTCSTCRWWLTGNSEYGFCKANPPLLDPANPPLAMWPMTQQNDFCAKHARIPQPKAEKVMVP